VVQERDEAWFAILNAGHVRDRSGPQELLYAIRHRAVGMAADSRPLGPRRRRLGRANRGGAGLGGVGAWGLVVHDARIAQAVDAPLLPAEMSSPSSRGETR
jgi:hypothetical protein